MASLYCAQQPINYKNVLVLLNIFCDIQLVVSLSHRCNSSTDLGKAKVESHASSETQPCQATLLLHTEASRTNALGGNW
jgi:hypothetical protein